MNIQVTRYEYSSHTLLIFKSHIMNIQVACYEYSSHAL